MSTKEKNIDESICITKKAATRIKGILEAEEKKRTRAKTFCGRRRLFGNEL